MSKDKKRRRDREDAAIEQDILAHRKYSLEDAIGRMAGGGLLKGDSPVPRKRQAEFQVERYLEQHLIDAQGALEVVLLRHVSNSDILLHLGYENPLEAMALVIENLLGSEPLLQRFVTEVDLQWGRANFERPRLEKPGVPPDPDDPYTFASVRQSLSKLLKQLPRA